IEDAPQLLDKMLQPDFQDAYHWPPPCDMGSVALHKYKGFLAARNQAQ
ncbi:hypothetical protein M8C21_023996, partial [Ambrosia artemisiifolia]